MKRLLSKLTKPTGIIFLRHSPLILVMIVLTANGLLNKQYTFPGLASDLLAKDSELSTAVDAIWANKSFHLVQRMCWVSSSFQPATSLNITIMSTTAVLQSRFQLNMLMATKHLLRSQSPSKVFKDGLRKACTQKTWAEWVINSLNSSDMSH